MKLSEQDAEVFFKLISGLLLFVNNQTGGHAHLSECRRIRIVTTGSETGSSETSLSSTLKYIDRYMFSKTLRVSAKNGARIQHPRGKNL